MEVSELCRGSSDNQDQHSSFHPWLCMQYIAVADEQPVATAGQPRLARRCFLVRADNCGRFAGDARTLGT
jgi:hypothetical protein